MFFLFLNLLNASYNQLGISLDNYVITRVGRDNFHVEDKLQKSKYLRFENNLPFFSKFYHPKGFVNMESFFETESVENLPFVTEKGDLYQLEGLDASVRRTDIFSLYLYNLINKLSVAQNRLVVNLACKDYLDSETIRKINKSISDLGYSSKVIPETLAVCLKDSENFSSETPVKKFYLNFRGSKVVGVLYEVSKNEDKINVKYIDSKEFNMKSDQQIDCLIENLILSKLNRTDDIAALPGEPLNDRKNYIFIKDYLDALYLNLSASVSSYKFLDIPIFLTETGEKYSSYNDIVISLDEIRDVIRAEVTENIKEIEEFIPADASKFFISNISYRKTAMPQISEISTSFITQGLFTAFNNKITIEDSRMSSIGKSTKEKELAVAIQQIELIQEVTKGLENMKNKIKSLKFIPEDQIEEFMKLTEDLSTSSANAFMIKFKYEYLISKNQENEALQITREYDIPILKKALADAEELLKDETQFEGRESFVNLYNTTKEWFDNALSDVTVTGFSSKIIKLKGFISTARTLINNAKKDLEKPVESEAVVENTEKKEDESKSPDHKDEEKENPVSNEESGKKCPIQDLIQEDPEEKEADSNNKNTNPDNRNFDKESQEDFKEFNL